MASKVIIQHLPRSPRRRIKRLSDKTQSKTVFRHCQIVLQAAQGQAPEWIARALGCHVSTVYRTVKAFRQAGEAARRVKTSPGRPRTVRTEHDLALEAAISQEPRALGKNFSNWTTRALAQHMGLAVHVVTIWRHLGALGWRWRRPRYRVASPDPRYTAKAQYVRTLRRAARRGHIHLYYTDEMDVALLPTLSGRWMRIGQQTHIDTPGQNQKHYVFGAVHAVTGQLMWLTWPTKNTIGFQQLLKALVAGHENDPRQIVVVADNYRIHKAQGVQTLVRRFRRQLRVYFLPTYAPQLNPIERVWRHFRRQVTDSFFFKTMDRLLQAVASFLAELECSPDVVRSIIFA